MILCSLALAVDSWLVKVMAVCLHARRGIPNTLCISRFLHVLCECCVFIMLCRAQSMRLSTRVSFCHVLRASFVVRKRPTEISHSLTCKVLCRAPCAQPADRAPHARSARKNAPGHCIYLYVITYQCLLSVYPSLA